MFEENTADVISYQSPQVVTGIIRHFHFLEVAGRASIIMTYDEFYFGGRAQNSNSIYKFRFILFYLFIANWRIFQSEFRCLATQS